MYNDFRNMLMSTVSMNAVKWSLLNVDMSDELPSGDNQGSQEVVRDVQSDD